MTLGPLSNHRRPSARWEMVLIVVAALAWLVPTAAQAHPLGNFTTNQYVGLHVEADRLTVDYVLDLAEIPASQQRRDIDQDDDRDISQAEASAFAASRCLRVAEELSVSLDGRRLAPVVHDRALRFPEGEAGLPTLRLECRLATAVTVDAGSLLEVDNTVLPDRLGWQEMVLTSTGVDASTDLPAESITRRLTEYPADLLSSPVEVRTAAATLTPKSGADRGTPPPPVGLAPEAASTPVDALASLVDPSAGSPALPIAMLVAVGLGVLHALAPGHGKTVMAAYLVGSRGTLGHAVSLGIAVALSHTIGVLALGVLTLVGTSAFAPEETFPILSTTSGVIITAIGVWMFVQWFRRREAADRPTSSQPASTSHPHSHDGFHHSHAVPGALQGKSGWKILASMGLAGGLVPSTSAVVLLLAAVNLGRIPLGIFLIALFGVGMATTLVGVGFALVTAHRLGAKRWGHMAWVDRVRRLLTPMAAVVVTVVGVFLALRGPA